MYSVGPNHNYCAISVFQPLNWLIEWLVNWAIFQHLSISWLADLLIHWLIDSLVDWSVGQLAGCLGSKYIKLKIKITPHKVERWYWPAHWSQEFLDRLDCVYNMQYTSQILFWYETQSHGWSLRHGHYFTICDLSQNLGATQKFITSDCKMIDHSISELINRSINPLLN